MSHLTFEEYNQIIANGKMFKIEGLFYGTKEDFENCYFNDLDYDSMVAFAEEYDCILEAYSEEEHKQWLKIGANK